MTGAWFGSTFRDLTTLRDNARALAAALPRLGAVDPSTVVLFARNSFLPLEVTMAVAVTGARVVPVSPHAIATAPASRLDASMNSLFYTSGTTGTPKGVVRAAPSTEETVRRQAVLEACYGLTPESRGLVTTPLCHMFSSNFAQTTLRLGGLLVVMPRFDATEFLRIVALHGITNAQVVPTMFVRLLRLPPDERARYDIGTLRHVLHTGAPCRPQVKHDMIDWFGPVIWEQYGSTETGVVALCDTPEWLAHPGTVGRPFLTSEIRIFSKSGAPCPPGTPGEIYAPDTQERLGQAAAPRRAGPLSRTARRGVTGQLRADLAAFFAECVYPAEAEFAADGGTGSVDSPVLARVAADARRRGLWNLFSSLHPARLAVSDPETADLAEIVGRSPVIGQVALHSLNPDAAVLELLAALGSAEQASAWLDALADGTISSAYCMTEPGVASSDPLSLLTRGERAADGTVRVTGVKSWCTGAEAANCEILVVLALTEPDTSPAGRHSLVLVRRDDPGVALTNRHDVLGYSDAYGPDEVHRRVVGRYELALNRAEDGAVPPASRSRAAPRAG